MKLFKEKIHQLFCGRINRQKLWKKIPQDEELFERGKLEGDKVIDIVLSVVERLGGGKRSGKEWEGMARGLKYVFYWAFTRMNPEQVKDEEKTNDPRNILNWNFNDLVKECQDIIH
jgi:hypothetical protein